MRRGPASRILIRSLIAGIGLFLVFEVALRLASSFSQDRSQAGWREGASVRVLAVGDSHTFGPAVEPAQSYPGQLQRILDERSPGTYSVVNIGIPGSNTSQLRNRFTLNLARWNPDVVVVWCGVNNAWNAAETEGAGLLARLDATLIHLKVYKFFRLWRNDRKMKSDPFGGLDETRHQIQHLGDGTHAVPFFGAVGTEKRAYEKHRGDAEIEAALADYRALRSMARDADVRPLFIRYQFSAMNFRVPNLALDALAREDDAIVVDAAKAVERLPKEKRYGWALHPSAEGYTEVARDVADVIIALR